MVKPFALCVVFVLVLTACATPTPTLAPQPTATPPGYPAPALPQPTLAQGYPAPTQPVSTEAPRATVAATDTVDPYGSDGVPAAAAITYQDFEIVPAQTTLKAGTTVVFTIKSASGGFHEPYTNDPAPAFDSGPNLGDGATYRFTFNKTGTFTLLCIYHSNMQATLAVTP